MFRREKGRRVQRAIFGAEINRLTDVPEDPLGNTSSSLASVKDTKGRAIFHNKERALVAQLVKALAHAFLPGGGVGSNPGVCSWEPPLFYEILGRASILEIAFSKPMVEQ